MAEPVAYEMREQPAQPVLSVRETTSVRALRGTRQRAFAAVAQYLGEIGEQPAGPPFVAYYNMGMEHLSVEIGFPVARVIPGRGNVQPGEIPGGRQAACTFTGPYTRIEAAFATLSAWMVEQSLEPTGVVYEFYLNDPAVTAPEALRTQIVFPLKPARP
jgi:effector-binding domain-containing protein